LHEQVPGLQHATLLLPAQLHADNPLSHWNIQLGTTPTLNLSARGFGENPRETARIWSGRFIAVTSLLDLRLKITRLDHTSVRSRSQKEKSAQGAWLVFRRLQLRRADDVWS